MKSTFNQGFSYPEPNDFGNGALDLQLLAEQFDAKMFAIQQGMFTELKPPSIIRTSSTLFSSIPINVNYEITSIFDTTTYINGFVDGTGFMTPPGAGSYMYGVNAVVQCSGTITANTFRSLTLNVAIPTGASLSSDYTKVTTDTANESGVSGGMALNVVSVMDIPSIPTNPPSQIRVFFRHANTGSTMNIAAGAILWCTKISNLVN